MSEDTYVGEYKGKAIWYYRYIEGGIYRIEGVLPNYNTLAEVYAAIDKLAAPPAKKDVGSQEPTTETRTPFQKYRDVIIYSDADVPDLFFSVGGIEYSTRLGEYDARRIIDTILGAPGPGEEGYEYISPLEPVEMTLPPEWSWIAGPLNLIKGFFDGISSGIGGTISGLGAAIGGIGQAFIDGLGGVGKSLAKPLEDVGKNALEQALAGTGEHSLDPELKAKVDALLMQLKKKQEKVIAGISHSVPDPLSALTAAWELASVYTGTSISLETAAAATDLVHPIKHIQARDIVTKLIDRLNINKLTSEVINMPTEKGLLRPIEKYYNAMFTPEIPPYQDLINQVVKEVITLDEFKKQMAYQGFNADWSQKIWDAHFIPPDWTQLLNAFYRGVVTREQLDSLMILIDLDPRYKNIFDAQIEQIPPYSELTNQLVKEVLTQDEYTKYLQWYGFDAIWSKRIWDAHFIPPSLSDILTAWRRGKITEAEVDKMMILVDLDPRYKEIFDTRKYVDPPLNMIRFMFETGNIDAAKVSELIHLQGYRPEHEEMITNYLTEFQSRLWRRRYLVSLSQGFEKGVYTQEQLEAAVHEAEYTPDVAKYIVANAMIRKEIAATKVVEEKPKLLSMGDLKKAYIENMITRDVLQTEVSVRGYPLDQADLLLKLLDQEKVVESAGGSKVALSQAELVDAWRYEEITEDQLRIELQLRGLSLAEVEILIRTKKKKWGVEEGVVS